MSREMRRIVCASDTGHEVSIQKLQPPNVDAISRSGDNLVDRSGKSSSGRGLQPEFHSLVLHGSP